MNFTSKTNISRFQSYSNIFNISRLQHFKISALKKPNHFHNLQPWAAQRPIRHEHPESHRKLEPQVGKQPAPAHDTAYPRHMVVWRPAPNGQMTQHMPPPQMQITPHIHDSCSCRPAARGHASIFMILKANGIVNLLKQFSLTMKPPDHTNRIKKNIKPIWGNVIF